MGNEMFHNAQARRREIGILMARIENGSWRDPSGGIIKEVISMGYLRKIFIGSLTFYYALIGLEIAIMIS
ncbi:MAG: hypothetical protein V3W43_04090, partial [Desulfatiglandaceae bacterium]